MEKVENRKMFELCMKSWDFGSRSEAGSWFQRWGEVRHTEKSDQWFSEKRWFVDEQVWQPQRNECYYEFEEWCDCADSLVDWWWEQNWTFILHALCRSQNNYTVIAGVRVYSWVKCSVLWLCWIVVLLWGGGQQLGHL